jgi:Carboxypeptidase regulatory-like domain
MRRISASILVTIAVSALPASVLAQQERASPWLEGIVVTTGNAEPLGKATVTLKSEGGPGSSTVRTSQDGRFAFSDVPPGRYRLTVTRPGYFTSRRGVAESALTVVAGQPPKSVRVVMTAAGAIAGRVSDADGDPLTNVPVQALRYSFQDGRRVFTPVATATTNDRGEYRLFWLRPGHYYIRATSPVPERTTRAMTTVQGVFDLAWAANGGGQDPADERYAAVYFPGTPDPQIATPIEVSAGGDYAGIDLRLIPVRPRRVRGVVVDANAQPAVRAMVSVVPRSPATPMLAMSAPTDGNGGFDIAGIPPGSYFVTAASAGRGERRAGGRLAIEVSDANVDRLSVVMTPGTDITGDLIVEGGRDTINARAHPAVVLEEKNRPQSADEGAEFLDGGTFMIGGVMAGDYDVRLYELPPGQYVKSIRFGPQDVLNNGLQIDGRSVDRLEIVVGTNAGALDGSAVNAQREPVPFAPVALVPARAQRHRTDLYKSASADESGRFRFHDVPPGDYILLAWDGDDDGSWQDPEFLRAYESRGRAVRVSGGASNIEVAVVHVP